MKPESILHLTLEEYGFEEFVTKGSGFSRTIVEAMERHAKDYYEEKIKSRKSPLRDYVNRFNAHVKANKLKHEKMELVSNMHLPLLPLELMEQYCIHTVLCIGNRCMISRKVYADTIKEVKAKQVIIEDAIITEIILHGFTSIINTKP